MDPELKALIQSDEFRRYCKGLHTGPFNPFDVLQVADLEIRHSNVLAWLLTPDETHGIGSRFLRALVEHLTRRHSVPCLRGLTGFDDKSNVEVRREDNHDGWFADVTVGFRAERVLLIIENKVGPYQSEAEGQVKEQQEALGKKYKGLYDDFPGALLTTSNAPEGRAESASMRGVMPLSWDDVRGIIRSLLDNQENFADGHVRAFVKRYLDVIEEKLTHAGDDLAEELRNAHPRILEKLQEEKSQGRTGLLDTVDKPQHRDTIKRWLEYFEGIPRKLREGVADYLTLSKRVGAGIKRASGRGAYRDSGWLHWWETPSGGKLGIGDCAWWWFSFESRNVTVELGTERNPKNPKMQAIWSFLQDTPIDPGRLERYPMENGVMYRHNLLKGDELSGSFEKTVKLLHDRLDEFFGPDGDYKRIERYFRCLAFDPRGPQQPDAVAGEG